MIGLLSFLTLTGDILLPLLLVIYFFRNKVLGVWNFIYKHKLLFSFIIALIATLGSLYLSEIANLTPCKLCWFQRIMMYPIVVILSVALITRSYDYRKYVIPMCIIGACISIYHYSTQIFFVPSFCSADTESCAIYQFISYGYITIPMMALTAFLMILSLALIDDRKIKIKKK